MLWDPSDRMLWDPSDRMLWDPPDRSYKNQYTTRDVPLQQIAEDLGVENPMFCIIKNR